MIDAVPAGLPSRTAFRRPIAIQDRMVELLGMAHRRLVLRLHEPGNPVHAGPGGALLRPPCSKQFILDSPARLEPGGLPAHGAGMRIWLPPGASDLPARSAPYGRDEVEAAIAAVHPTIEVVAGHLRDWPNQDVFSVIADNGTDGALIVGPGARGVART